MNNIKKYLEKNKELKYRNDELEKIISNYIDIVIHQRKRIDKAIEYINKYNKTINYQQELGMYREFMIIPKELLDILRGEDNE